ncbi:hypothetical protein A1O1_04668 [Capronia coronata CBS 617.96]|uniref:Uncharacterized protein n=1 Tax=Capronia coronata CBS 617.96 TaxID=1182541 RepID=W9Y4I7_9EURO|nr:uncharacterized protein A1O1_04668 [Capronia coronata CBS 617.96]EXJ87742.1 hypothetical protein A1O1_04668 [Capronia coronata CBS 617.96]
MGTFSPGVTIILAAVALLLLICFAWAIYAHLMPYLRHPRSRPVLTLPQQNTQQPDVKNRQAELRRSLYGTPHLLFQEPRNDISDYYTLQHSHSYFSTHALDFSRPPSSSALLSGDIHSSLLQRCWQCHWDGIRVEFKTKITTLRFLHEPEISEIPEPQIRASACNRNAQVQAHGMAIAVGTRLSSVPAEFTIAFTFTSKRLYIRFDAGLSVTVAVYAWSSNVRYDVHE